jgi:hypothetical protein
MHPVVMGNLQQFVDQGGSILGPTQNLAAPVDSCHNLLAARVQRTRKE